MAQVVWRASAEDDLPERLKIHWQDSPEAALSLLMRIMSATRRLHDFPESWRIGPEHRAIGLRDIIVGRDRILYESKRVRVAIVTVRNAARRFGQKDVGKP